MEQSLLRQGLVNKCQISCLLGGGSLWVTESKEIILKSQNTKGKTELDIFYRNPPPKTNKTLPCKKEKNQVLIFTKKPEC